MNNLANDTRVIQQQRKKERLEKVTLAVLASFTTGQPANPRSIAEKAVEIAKAVIKEIDNEDK